MLNGDGDMDGGGNDKDDIDNVKRIQYREEDEHEEVRMILTMIIRGDIGKRGDEQEEVKMILIIRKRRNYNYNNTNS